MFTVIIKLLGNIIKKAEMTWLKNEKQAVKKEIIQYDMFNCGNFLS